MSGCTFAARANAAGSSFFKPGHAGLRVGAGMDRPRLLSREAQRTQDLAEAGDVVAVPETRLDQPGDVGPGPGRDAVALGIRAAQDQRSQCRLLPFG